MVLRESRISVKRASSAEDSDVVSSESLAELDCSSESLLALAAAFLAAASWSFVKKRTKMKIEKAIMMKSITFWRKRPYAMLEEVFAPKKLWTVIFREEKLMPPRRIPMIGVMMSETSELTILEKAPPMITPTASSTTLPRLMKALKSSKKDLGSTVDSRAF